MSDWRYDDISDLDWEDDEKAPSPAPEGVETAPPDAAPEARSRPRQAGDVGLRKSDFHPKRNQCQMSPTNRRNKPPVASLGPMISRNKMGHTVIGPSIDRKKKGDKGEKEEKEDTQRLSEEAPATAVAHAPQEAETAETVELPTNSFEIITEVSIPTVRPQEIHLNLVIQPHTNTMSKNKKDKPKRPEKFKVGEIVVTDLIEDSKLVIERNARITL